MTVKMRSVGKVRRLTGRYHWVEKGCAKARGNPKPPLEGEVSM